MKFLTFATDILPTANLPTSGTALRTHGLVEGLRANGHEVVVSVPKDAVDGALKAAKISDNLSTDALKSLKSFSQLSFDSFNQAHILAEVNPDVVLCGHWPAMILPRKPSQALIVDLAGPHLLERHYQQSPDQSDATLAKLGVAATADYFIVSGNSQRLYFLSFLLRAGVLDPQSRIIPITMPLDPNIPTQKDETDSPTEFPRFIFGGVFLPWQDPSAGLLAVSDILSKQKTGSLTLIGGKHPNYDIKQGSYEKLFEQLSLNPYIKTHPMLPLEAFISKLLDADVAIDLMKWNLERQLAMTIRSTTYLWAGVPVLYNDYADLGELIKKYDAGWCVNPDDKLAIDQVLTSIFNNPDIVKQKSQNASRLAREIFSWDIAVKPILELLSGPRATSSIQTDIMFDYPENADFPVTKNSTLEQYFVCRINGLSKVECRIATHGRKSLKPLTFKLYDVENPDKRNLIANSTIEGAEISNNEWLALETKPVDNSQGRTYLLEISSNETNEQLCASPWAIKSSPYPLLDMRYKGFKVQHTGICMRTTCRAAA